jgi:hypothetical protein
MFIPASVAAVILRKKPWNLIVLTLKAEKFFTLRARLVPFSSESACQRLDEGSNLRTGLLRVIPRISWVFDVVGAAAYLKRTERFIWSRHQILIGI